MQLNVSLGPTALKLFEYYSLVFLCLTAPSQKKGLKQQSNLSFAKGQQDTEIQGNSNNLRAIGPKSRFSCAHQLKTRQQKTKQEQKTQDQKNVNK